MEKMSIDKQITPDTMSLIKREFCDAASFERFRFAAFEEAKVYSIPNPNHGNGGEGLLGGWKCHGIYIRVKVHIDICIWYMVYGIRYLWVMEFNRIRHLFGRFFNFPG